jgi:hypothetical protein
MKLAIGCARIALVAVALFSAGTALADPPWARDGDDEHGRGHHETRHESRHDGGIHVSISIGSDDRATIREYLGRHYRDHCPPGLAKKHNGCLPPGLAKHYSVGRPLADSVEYEDVPDDLLGRLQPLAAGYSYVMVDKDVLLISEATKKVIDAVTLLSAVGH